jgi:hypothetical protein
VLAQALQRSIVEVGDSAGADAELAPQNGPGQFAPVDADDDSALERRERVEPSSETKKVLVFERRSARVNGLGEIENCCVDQAWTAQANEKMSQLGGRLSRRSEDLGEFGINRLAPEHTAQALPLSGVTSLEFLEPAGRADEVLVVAHMMAQLSEDQSPGVDCERRRGACVVAVPGLEEPDCGHLLQVGSLQAPAQESPRAASAEVSVAGEERFAIDGRAFHASVDYEDRLLPNLIHEVTKVRMRIGCVPNGVGGT